MEAGFQLTLQFAMKKGRLEAFSDGVLAIIITIMVLELKVPHGTDFEILKPLLPVFMSYILSFIYIGIYWNNHHHLMQAVERVNGGILWANMHLLFWLSLVPFVTGWMGENHFAALPVALYGVVLLMAAFAYYLLSIALIRHHGKESLLAIAYGKDFKGKISLAIYITAIAVSFFSPWVSMGLYTFVAIIWFIPDTRIEKNVK
jgi:uncharacterized membrane protein